MKTRPVSIGRGKTRLRADWSPLLLVLLLAGLPKPVPAQIIFPDPPRTNCPLRLEVLLPAPNGWPRVRGDFHDSNAPPQVFTLQVSTDLVHWHDAAVLLHTPFDFTDPSADGQTARFYRIARTPRGNTNDWANQLQFPGDPFFNVTPCSATSPLVWAKFALLLDDPNRVIFQDSRAYPLHYEFAVQRLPLCFGLSPEQFNAVSLRTNGQRVVLGVILAPQFTLSAPQSLWPFMGREYGIQFVGQDPYPPEQVARWFEVVKSAVAASPEVTAFYLPTFEQADSAWRNENWFAARGIPLASLERWTGQATTIYAGGWAVGRLVFVPGAEIAAAYADGRLCPEDILLTDAVPAEIPFVAGILSLAPATPGSHVALLAQNYGVPFASLAGADERGRAQGLIGHDIALRTESGPDGDRIKLLDLEGVLTPAQKAQIAAFKIPQLHLIPKARYGAYTADTAKLMPADIRFFGGKAANFGLLRRAIPDFSPEAIAFSFDLWDEFLNQTLPDGRTLAATIQARLEGFQYPPNVAAVRMQLTAIRGLFTQTAQLTPAQEQAVLGALAGFDPHRKIRFRSSTNLEDSESFTGAGLYDSFSGCLADDLDDDTTGPCHCDASQPKERGVFRAIKKVFASFYNENAFLERLRLGVDESQAGMALLVHYSTPDEIELANGVATLTAQLTPIGWNIRGTFVTQLGAASVTNPNDAAAPEIVDFQHWFGATNLSSRQSSALVPWGDYVLSWPADYQHLAGLAATVAAGYGTENTNRSLFQLVLEYKKLQPGRLYVKQVREIRLPTSTNLQPVFLLSEATEWLVSPGSGFEVVGSPMPQGSGVFAMHRLKSKWQLRTTNVLLHTTNLAASLYHTANVEFAETSPVRVLTGRPADWPDASFATASASDPNRLITLDGWTQGTGAARRAFTLFTEWPLAVSARESQWRTVADAQLALQVTYATPVAVSGVAGSTFLTTNESVLLFRSPEPLTNLAGFEPGLYPPGWRSMTTNPISIATTLRWLPCRVETGPPLDPCNPWFPSVGTQYSYVGGAGETRIEGLLSEPLVLRDYYAQTLWAHGRTGHEHVEELILDPWREPGLDDAVKAELNARNIRLIYFHSYCFGGCEQNLTVLGWDNVFRSLPDP